VPTEFIQKRSRREYFSLNYDGKGAISGETLYLTGNNAQKGSGACCCRKKSKKQGGTKPRTKKKNGNSWQVREGGLIGKKETHGWGLRGPRGRRKRGGSGRCCSGSSEGRGGGKVGNHCPETALRRNANISRRMGN